jgi:hypothetical protein
MTLPVDVKTLQTLGKGSVAGIVILGYILLRMDYKELKDTSRADYKELTEKYNVLESRMYEQQNTVLKEAIKAMEEFNLYAKNVTRNSGNNSDY